MEKNTKMRWRCKVAIVLSVSVNLFLGAIVYFQRRDNKTLVEEVELLGITLFQVQDQMPNGDLKRSKEMIIKTLMAIKAANAHARHRAEWERLNYYLQKINVDGH